MFFEIEMTRNVVVSPDGLHSGLLLQRSIILQLIEDISRIQATEENGYLVAVTTLEGRGEGKIREMTGSVIFPVKFKCIVFKPFQNEILEGGIEVVMKTGVHVTCGPMAEVFIPSQKMTDFEFIPGENPIFRNKQSSNVEKGGKIRFKILAIKWLEQRRVFQALGSLEGDFLGPVFDPEITTEMDSESPKMNAGEDDENPTINPENNDDNPSKNADINTEHIQVNPDLNDETNSEMNPQKDTETVDPQINPECLQRNSEMNLETNSEKDLQQNSELRTETMNTVIDLIDLETISEMNPSQNAETMNSKTTEMNTETMNSKTTEMNTETMNSKTTEMNTETMNSKTTEMNTETMNSKTAEMNTETMNSKTSLEQLQAYSEMDVQQISDTEI